MTPHRLALAGLHAFPREVAIDFDALPALIGVQGANGSGKTTLLEALTAATHLVMPSRPSALHRNFARPGFIRLAWSHDGRRYVSLVRCDPAAERTEASLSDETGALIAGPLVRDYRRAIEAILGPLEAVLATTVTIQSGAGAFLRCSRSERKALLAGWLGLERYGRYQLCAKAERISVETRRTGLLARRALRQEDAAQLDGLRAAHQGATAALDAAQVLVQETARTVSLERSTFDAYRAEVRDLGKTRDEHAAMEREREAARTAINDLRQRRQRNEALVPRAEEIRAAVMRDAALTHEMVMVNHDLAAANREARTARELEHRRLTLDRDRVSYQRAGQLLAIVPCHGEGDYAGCPLLKDARAAGEALPVVLAELETLPALGASHATAAIDALSVRQVTLRTEQVGLRSLVELAAQLDVAEARIEELTGQIGHAEVLYDGLVLGVTYRAERLAQQETVAAALREAEAGLASAESAQRRAAGQVLAAARDLATLDAQIAAAETAEAEVEALTRDLAPLDTDIVDWSLLDRACSPSGIPALLIDQALPEIGARATDLLRECFGESLFSILLTTQREAASGDKFLETLDVLVTRDGEPLDASVLSGGESVLVSEALALALTLVAGNGSGGVLIRDEVGAALDVTRGPAFIRMLRRAADLGGFAHVLVVSHQPTSLDLCDAQLVVGGGRVEVR